MKENENEEPSVTDAELVPTPRTNAAAFHINADGPAYYHSEGGYVGRDLAETLERELAAARAAIKVAREILTKAKRACEFAVSTSAASDLIDSALAQLNTNTHEKTKP